MDFDEVLRGEEAADALDDAGAQLERLYGDGVDEKVQVAVLNQLLRVLKLVGELVETWRQELGRGRGVDGELAGGRAPGKAGDGDDVSNAEGGGGFGEDGALAADDAEAGDALDLVLVPEDVEEEESL